VEQLHLLDAVAGGDADASGEQPGGAAPGAGAATRPPARVERGRRSDADLQLTVALDRDQRGPDRQAPREAVRAIDRIEDPARRSRCARRVPLLFPEDAVIGEALEDACAQGGLHGAVAARDERP